MKQVATLFLVSLSLLLADHSAENFQAQGIDAKSAKRGVEEYVAESTTPARKTSLLNALVGAAQADLLSALKGSWKKPESRVAALELATKLQVRGLFGTVEKSLADYPAEIVALGLITNDKGAALSLYKSWLASPEGAEPFTALHAGFTRVGVDLAVIDEFGKCLASKDVDDARKTLALEVLRFQAAFDAADPVEGEMKWPAFAKTLGTVCKRQTATGVDVMAQDGWKLTSASRRGPNLYLETGGFAVLDTEATPGLESGKYSVTFWIYMEAGEHEVVPALLLRGASGKLGAHGPTASGGKWRLVIGSETFEVPYKTETWTQVTLNIEAKISERKTYTTMSVDGKALNPKEGITDGLPMGFQIADKGGKSVFGAIDYRRR